MKLLNQQIFENKEAAALPCLLESGGLPALISGLSSLHRANFAAALFERLEMRDPDHIAVKYYKDYHSGSAKTLKSIQITLAARLEKFNEMVKGTKQAATLISKKLGYKK